MSFEEPKIIALPREEKEPTQMRIYHLKNDIYDIHPVKEGLMAK